MTNDQFDNLLKKAEEGNVDSMLYVGVAYLEGDPIPKDEKESFNWIEKAAEAGNNKAMVLLSSMYSDGQGVEADDAMSITWELKAAESGDMFSMQVVAYRHYSGLGVEKSQKLGFEWMRKSAQAGNVNAMWFVSQDYRVGKRVRKNKKLANEWRVKAAEGGAPVAMTDLSIYFRDKKSDEYSPKDSFKWAERAANIGEINAMILLSFYYSEGFGVKKDVSEQVKWLIKSATHGSEIAMYELALEYFKGEIVERDINSFNKWINKAAKYGELSARITQWLSPILIDDKVNLSQFDELSKLFHSLYSAVEKIKKKHVVDPDEAKNGVAHFTTIDAINEMIPSDSKEKLNNHIRLYNVEYVNDPQEGIRLLDSKDSNTSVLKDFFYEEDSHKNVYFKDKEISVYVGSFTLSVDRLDLWRAYGNDGNGICIVTPLEKFKEGESNSHHQLHDIIYKYHDTFDDEVDIIEYEKDLITKINDVTNNKAIDNDISCFEYTSLYKVLYQDEDVKEALKILAPTLRKIKKIVKSYDEYQNLVYSLVRSMIIDILYLYKNDEYKTEHEARILLAYDISDSHLSLDSNNPQKIFSKTPNFLFSEEGFNIIIGPKVKDSNSVRLNIKYRLAKHGLLGNCSVNLSDVKYR